ncbi:MAG: ATP-binding protein [Anaerolineae bacterium]|nr:ATP-binding protein [Anaerolineae bacterium]
MANQAERVFHDVVLGDLSIIRAFVRETAVSFGCVSSEIDEFVVAVDEAAANIIRHGYKGQPGIIKITVLYTGDTFKVMLCDQSAQFDPTTVASPDMTLPLAERPFGGMGVHIMREFCDDVSYRRTANGENELTLLKRVKIRNEG